MTYGTSEIVVQGGNKLSIETMRPSHSRKYEGWPFRSRILVIMRLCAYPARPCLIPKTCGTPLTACMVVEWLGEYCWNLTKWRRKLETRAESNAWPVLLSTWSNLNIIFWYMVQWKDSNCAKTCYACAWGLSSFQWVLLKSKMNENMFGGRWKKLHGNSKSRIEFAV